MPYTLVRLTPYHWQPRVSQFCDITKGVLWINTGSLGIKIAVALAKFADLVIGYSLVPVGNRVS